MTNVRRPTLTRREDWPERLEAVFADASRTPFVYGGHDCATHAADAIAAVTGSDLAAAWRGAYATDAEGRALVEGQLGVKTLAGLAHKLLPSVHPVFARRGDLGLAAIGANRSLMFVVFDGAWLRGPCGASAPRAAAVRAWKVG